MMKDDIRIILPKMVNVSNNSRLTQELASVLIEKLTSQEIDDFKRWLQLIK